MRGGKLTKADSYITIFVAILLFTIAIDVIYGILYGFHTEVGVAMTLFNASMLFGALVFCVIGFTKMIKGTF